MAELVACLDELWDELDEIAPDRDTSSDGWIGDAAHQERTSSHNDDEAGKVPIYDADSKHEVHALDADKDLRRSDVTMEDVVQHILARCRSGQERRLRYIIYNRRIWEASNNWRQRSYTGSNPHDQHAHFDASYETALEADRSSWGLKELVKGKKKTMIVREGDEGEEVRFHQYLLNRVDGAGLTVDGVYGPKMAEAVNRYRAKHTTSGSATLITGWMFYHMLGLYAAQYAGKDGVNGKDGAAGKDGADGVLTGVFTITGGTLTAVDEGGK